MHAFIFNSKLIPSVVREGRRHDGSLVESMRPAAPPEFMAPYFRWCKDEVVIDDDDDWRMHATGA